MPVRQRRQGVALVLTIDRPQRRNAINAATACAIGSALERAAEDDSLRAVVLTAAGTNVFVAGGDLKEFVALEDDSSGAQRVIDLGEALEPITTSPLPVIAAVGGHVLGGGCELLALCDLVVMEEHATIEFRHAAMGLAPAWGGTSRLLERVGSGWAAELLMTGRPVGAREALSMGLVNRVVPTGDALGAALEIVELIARNPRRGVAAVKQSLTAARAAQRGGGLDAERTVFRWAWAGPEHREALEAFRRRR